MEDKRSSQSGRRARGKGRSAGSRRRGEELENAVLKAAWEELREAGYSHLTMEGVAKRAKSNKNSLYRRWPNKPDLVIAALLKYLPRPSKEVPDTGSLRGDVLALLHKLTHTMQAIGAETIHGLLMEDSVQSRIFGGRKPDSGEFEEWDAMMIKILDNAKKRGEVDFAKIHPRVVSLPLALLRNEFLMTFEPVSDKTVAEIVDEVFLPLVKSGS